LEQGIKEGLAEGPTIETAPQNAVEPGAPAGIVNEPFISPYIEGESLKKLWSSRQENKDPEIINISIKDDAGFQVNTIIDDLMPEEATQSDLFLGEPASDLIKGIIEPPTAQRATKILLWKRELAASTSD
jgi:hypothetical protein